MSKNSITSTAPTTKEWYTQEITKAYNNVRESKQAYYKAVTFYNKEMAKVFAKAYKINLKENMADRVRLTKEYKKEYRDLCDIFLRVGKLYSDYLNYLHLLNQLQKERREYYGKLGKQSN